MKISDNNLAAVLESLTPAERRVVEDCAKAARFTSNETIELLRRAVLRKVKARLKRKARSKREAKFKWLT